MTDTPPETGVVTAADLTKYYRRTGYLAFWEGQYNAVPGSAKVESIDENGDTVISLRLKAPLHKVGISFREFDDNERYR